MQLGGSYFGEQSSSYCSSPLCNAHFYCALKNICPDHATKANETIYDECNWGLRRCTTHKFFYYEPLYATCYVYIKMKFLAVADTRFHWSLLWWGGQDH